ncbi:MAG: protein kinase [Anaerolineae bacterium]|nr:protein kinase [Anaerolineae bacterium]
MIHLIGQTLGQYELIDVVGEGGLATVYKAYQPKLERWVAVKVLHSNNRDLLARFEREAKAVAQLRHRNILIVYEYGEEAGWPYIAMEYVQEGTLKNYLTGRPMDGDRVVTLAIPIAQALHHAHEHGLIHRDVKPSNILMPQPDWPLLADFGLVKMQNPDAAITNSDIIIGTPAYIPPEQAKIEPVDPRADMYSLGVIMFQMVTGCLPFEYKNPNEMINAHISEPAPSPHQFNPGCPPKLAQVILTALQKLPENRYANLQVMTGALQEILQGTTKPLFSAGMPVEVPLSPAEVGPMPPNHGLQTVPRQEVKILLKDDNITLDVPEPNKDGLIIGRSHSKAQAEIDLAPYGALEAGVSRRHARLLRQGEMWLIEDLGSMNGTYLNKKKLDSGVPTPLQNGDQVRCSKLSFVFLI